MYFESKFGNIFYEDYGPKNATAIVFSHGVSMDHQTFNHQVEALKSTYRVVVWDMPFHGKSDFISKELQYSLACADCLIELLNYLNIDRAILAGLSLGSFIVQQVEYKYPERVIAAIHISGGPLHPKFPSLLKLLNPLYSFFIKIYPNKLLWKSFAKHKSICPETIKYLLEVCPKMSKDILIHLLREMITDMAIGLPKPSEQPFLIIYGDHDLNFIKKMNNNWHNRGINSRLVVVKNAHHITNQDNPEEFNLALIDFLNNL